MYARKFAFRNGKKFPEVFVVCCIKCKLSIESLLQAYDFQSLYHKIDLYLFITS
jgi:hypothetical protein